MLELFYHLLYMVLGVSNGGSFPATADGGRRAGVLGTSSEGDMEARNKLIEHNLRLVAHIIKKSITASQRDQEDLLDWNDRLD